MPPETSEQKVRRLANKLLERPITYKEWRELITQQEVDEALGAHGDAPSSLEAAARKISKTVRARRNTWGSDVKAGSYVYTPSDEERAVQEALYEFIECQVAQNEEVRRYRASLVQHTPNGLLVPKDDTFHFLGADLIRFLTFEELGQIGAKPHDSVKVVPIEFGNRLKYQLCVSIEDRNGPIRHSSTGTSSVEKRFSYRDITVEFEEWQCIGFVSNGVRTFGSRLNRHPYLPRYPVNADFWRAQEWGFHHTPIQAEQGYNSILTFQPTIAGQALETAEWIAREYALELEDALDLLLTGHLPRHAFIQAWFSSRVVMDTTRGVPDYLAHGPITIQVEPWVPVEKVASVIRDMQRSIYGEREIRLPSARNVGLFSFVNRSIATAIEKLRWDDLCQHWQVATTDDLNRLKDWRNFRQTYARILEKLMPMNEAVTGMRMWTSKHYLRRRDRREVPDSAPTDDEEIDTA